eukprot:SAG31_NODE_242_length_19350_cov_3.043998_6_plen_55_part_00
MHSMRLVALLVVESSCVSLHGLAEQALDGTMCYSGERGGVIFEKPIPEFWGRQE